MGGGGGRGGRDGNSWKKGEGISILRNYLCNGLRVFVFVFFNVLQLYIEIEGTFYRSYFKNQNGRIRYSILWRTKLSSDWRKSYSGGLVIMNK